MMMETGYGGRTVCREKGLVNVNGSGGREKWIKGEE